MSAMGILSMEKKDEITFKLIMTVYPLSSYGALLDG